MIVWDDPGNYMELTRAEARKAGLDGIIQDEGCGLAHLKPGVTWADLKRSIAQVKDEDE